MTDPAPARKGGLGLRPCTAACVSIVLSFILGQFSLARPPLPQDLEHIVSMNTQSQQRLHTAVGTLDNSVWWKVGNRGTLSYTSRYSFWIEGKKVREDHACIRDDSKPKRIITSEPNSTSTTWVCAPSAWLTQHVILPETSFGWTLELQHVGVSEGNPESPYGGNQALFFSQMPPAGERLADIVLSLASEGRLPTVTDDLWDGIACKRLEWSHGTADPDGATRIWVAPSKGYMVVADQAIVKGQLVQEYSAKLREYDHGVFWFAEADEKHWGKEGLYDHTSTKINSLCVNVPIDPGVFTMGGLGIPADTAVVGDSRRIPDSTRSSGTTQSSREGVASRAQVLAAKGFEGAFTPDVDIPVGISLGTPDHGQLELVKLRFETTLFGNAWRPAAAVRWRGLEESRWRISMRLMDRQGQVLDHPNDKSLIVAVARPPHADSGQYSASIDLAEMDCEMRRHATRFRVDLEQMDDPAEAGRPVALLAVQVIDATSRQPLDRPVLLASIPRGSRPGDRVTYLFGGDREGRVQVQVPALYSAKVPFAVQHEGHATLSASLWLDDLRAREPIPLPRAGRIGGIISDQDDRPIEGACVYSHVSKGYEGLWCSLEASTLTDREGRWVVDGVPLDAHPVDMTVSHAGCRAPAGDRLWFIPAADISAARRLEYVRKMVRGAVLSGTVQDDQGRPVRDATVRMVFDDGGYCDPYTHVLTDSAGRFLLGCGAQGYRGAGLLLVEAQGFVPAVAQVQSGETTTPVDFRLERGRPLGGSVVDAKGNAVADAWIKVHPLPERPWYELTQRRTDSQGRFVLAAMPAKVLISAGKQGFITVYRQPFPPEPNEPVVRLRPAVHASGKVVDANDGQPIARFQVAVCEPDESERAADSGRVYWEWCRDGIYDKTLEEAFEGGRVILVRADGHSPQMSRPFAMDAGEQQIDFSLAPDPSYKIRRPGTPEAGLISGVVLDPNARPAANVVVFAACKWRMSVDTLTLQDGTFRLDFECPDGESQSCVVVARDTLRNLVAAVSLDDVTATGKIQLSPGVRLTGKVQGPDGRGIRNARVSPTLYVSTTEGMTTGWPGRDAVAIQDDGSFAISAVLCGPRYSVVAEAEGYGRGSAEVKTPEEKPQVDLPPISLAVADQSVAGRVVRPDSRPAAGLSVSVSGSSQPCLETTTDQDGRFSLQGLVRGEVQLQAYTSYASQKPQLSGTEKAQAGDRDVRIVVSEVDEQGRPVKPALPRPPSLLGRPTPSLAGLSSGLSPLQDGSRPMLVCFVDMEQRPSRRCLSDLAARSETLAAKGIAVAVVQVSKADRGLLDEWLKANKIDFPIHVMEGDIEVKKAQWGVKALPWLILTDRGHVVRAEGLAVNGLDRLLGAMK